MGCNCKSNKKPMNNLRNPDHITEAKKTYNDIIQGRDIDSFTELEKVIIMQTYSSLYPASSEYPTMEEAVKQIKTGIEVYDVRYRKK